jgi:hypothetical protein
MTRRAALFGLVAGLTYLALAALSAHLSPLARRPLLDGFAPPPPYRWAKPPPNLASINKPPLSGRYTVDLGGPTGGEGLFATKDSQASILLVGGSIAPPPSARSVQLTLEPRAPSAAVSLPRGVTISGNVYTIGATAEPTGRTITKLAKSAVVTLVYPAVAGPHRPHRILGSTDGKHFAELPSTDSPVLQQITAHTKSFGSFAVGVREAGRPAPAPTQGSHVPITAVVIAVAAVAAVIIGWLRWRARRAAAAHAARRGSAARGTSRGGPSGRHAAPTRKRRRPGRERDDPWR